jgi:hypothetical protein
MKNWIYELVSAKYRENLQSSSDLNHEGKVHSTSGLS